MGDRSPEQSLKPENEANFVEELIRFHESMIDSVNIAIQKHAVEDTDLVDTQTAVDAAVEALIKYRAFICQKVGISEEEYLGEVHSLHGYGE